jgi:hypothetical protein
LEAASRVIKRLPFQCVYISEREVSKHGSASARRAEHPDPPLNSLVSSRRLHCPQVTLEDGTYFVDTDATAAFWCAWRELGRRCKRAVGPDAATALKRSGLSLFGLRHKEVAALVQSLPDAARCEKLRAWVRAVYPQADPDLGQP